MFFLILFFGLVGQYLSFIHFRPLYSLADFPKII